jgi:hypothetical protein
LKSAATRWFEPNGSSFCAARLNLPQNDNLLFFLLIAAIDQEIEQKKRLIAALKQQLDAQKNKKGNKRIEKLVALPD